MAVRIAPMRVRDSHGFTLPELLIVVALVFVLSAMVALVVPGRVREAKADGEMRRVIAELRRAKEMATSQRRDIEVQFVGTNELRLRRLEVPITAPPTQLSSVVFEGDIVFQHFAALPDTPDGFGNTAALDFGTSTTFIFRSEGTFTDGNANLDPISGTIFLGEASDEMSAHAVTIFGPTGVIRGYRWNGREWVE
jgi:prepilin-type N-terminal cleavage/methylation domain-containing protein